MKIPTKIPGMRWLTAIVGLYGLIWISLEGALWQAILLALGLGLLGASYLLQRSLGGRNISAGRWMMLSFVLGGGGGLACNLLTLVLMAIKTGLHGHGPEFTPAEIGWLFRQVPLWAIAGGLAGLGLGMFGLALQRPR
jgi:hypothetical protein